VPRLIETVRREGLAPLIEAMPLRWFTEEVRAKRPELVEHARSLITSNTIEGYIACADAMTRLDFMDRLHEISLRTLLICGAQDMGNPPEGMREMARRMPNATYVEIDPAGHLSNIENPDAFHAALVPFLDSSARP